MRTSSACSCNRQFLVQSPFQAKLQLSLVMQNGARGGAVCKETAYERGPDFTGHAERAVSIIEEEANVHARVVDISLFCLPTHPPRTTSRGEVPLHASPPRRRARPPRVEGFDVATGRTGARRAAAVSGRPSQTRGEPLQSDQKARQPAVRTAKQWRTRRSSRPFRAGLVFPYLHTPVASKQIAWKRETEQSSRPSST